MHWNENNYPASMKNLTAPVRRKAIEMANQLLGEGYEEGRAIPIAIYRAEQWARDRGKPVKKLRKDGREARAHR